MASQAPMPSRIHFDAFELDAASGELRKNGILLKLQPQPFRVLLLLIERVGQVVTREEIQRCLWTDSTFVDFEHGINFSVNQIRGALSDNAEKPRYIETLPRRGYRFIATVKFSVAPIAPAVDDRISEAPPRTAILIRKRRHFLVALGLVAVVAAAVGWRWHVRQRVAPIRSLAVLPFENLSGDPAHDYLADGMTDALISDLGQISSLRVISRTSSIQYKGARKPLPEIATELNVEGVVEGTVSRLGNRVRVTAQLIEAQTDHHLWARTYERDSQDVLALQDEVALAIANEIKLKLTARDQARLANARPVKADAVEEYLKGRYFLTKLTQENVAKSIEQLELSVTKDPDFAQAYAALSNAYFLDAGISGPEQAVPKARAAARKALELDDSLAEAHTSLAMIAFIYDWDWEGAQKEFVRTLDSNPGDAGAHASYASYLVAMGKTNEAIAEGEQARNLDPLSPAINGEFTEILYLARYYDRLFEVCQKMLELDPNSLPAHSSLNLAYEQKQMFAEAAAQQEKTLTLIGADKLAETFRLDYSRSGYQAASRGLLDEFIKRSDQSFVSPYAIAAGYSFVGEEDLGFQWLEKAYRKRSPGLISIRVDPRLDPLRSDPRFQDLLRRMNFPG